MTNLSDAARRKLAALGQLLRATGRDSAYEIKVIDIPMARIGLFERSVVLISQNALALADKEDLEAIMAHELGREPSGPTISVRPERGNHNRLKQLELMCDAIAIVILHGLDGYVAAHQKCRKDHALQPRVRDDSRRTWLSDAVRTPGICACGDGMDSAATLTPSQRTTHLTR